MSSLSPIMHGYSDPTEIPYYCKKCVHYCKNGSSFPTCSKREDGKFKPDICFSCLERKHFYPKNKKEDTNNDVTNG